MALQRPTHGLYLSRDDVLRCETSPRDIRTAVEEAFRAKHAGTAGTASPLSMAVEGNYFDAKGGFLPDYAAVKWYGYFPRNANGGLPNFWPMIVLNEMRSGCPVAILDGSWISEVRTAAITAVAARHLAPKASRHVAFIACGAQAASHLAALGDLFPIDRVSAHSRRLASAETFAARARESGFDAEAFADPHAAMAHADIVVTSVPHKTLEDGFLNAAALRAGAFVSMVDLGYSWQRSSLSAFGEMVTDDLDQVPPGRGFNTDRRLRTDLAAIVGGAVELAPAATKALIFAGTGLADVAVARLVFQRATARGLGVRLPL